MGWVVVGGLILIYHFLGPKAQLFPAWSCFKSSWTQRSDPGNFAHVVNQSDTPESSCSTSLFSDMDIKQLSLPMYIIKKHVKMTRFSFLLSSFFLGVCVFQSVCVCVWMRSVVGVHEEHQRLEGDLCDVWCSWCLCGRTGPSIPDRQTVSQLSSE